eukprot:TRINITY_DN8853_c3_g1_i1.p1 TRINITY_DN8853_c3_g1~~TRINITY_DN8853_c3_g1_i1.p1  ORF type:complete len:858 (+),score=289.12 TRINITY_DN8853_c3_g1_i1:57-2630(+)
MAEPSTKKQKTEDGAVDTGVKAVGKVEEKPSIPEPAKELEADAPKSSGPKVKLEVTFLTQDTTMNVMQSTSGGILMPVSDGGLRHLLAGARASVGLKAGRYMFEAKILESVARAEDSQKPSPKNLLKIGFSTAGSSLLMGSAETDICFDSEGGLYHNKKRIGGVPKFSNYSIVAVLLNLDASSPNANTISLFKDGKRVCQPQELPESLKGKVLYPTVTYRNVAVHVNFGPEPMAALPFSCTMVQDASVKDSAVSTAKAPKDGKCEVVFPTCLPDEGGFDWVDMFKTKNPDYTELSDRMILDWALRSGLPASKSGSNDKPDIKFGIPDMDNVSVRRMILSLAPLQQRNYIVMEIYGNLVQEARAGNLRRFFDGTFKKVSYVVVGEPNAEFKKKNQELMLAEKQALADIQFKREKAEEARKRVAEKNKKLAEKAKKKAEKEKQKKIAEMKKAQEKAKKEAAKKKAAAEGKELPEEEPEEEKKDEEMEVDDDDEEEESDEPMEQEDPPKVELTAEEKSVVFRKLKDSDMSLYLLNTSFTKFSVPTADEGFDEVKYEWAKGSKASEHLKKWILDRKQSSRVEDIVPSAWFKGKWATWQKTLSGWRQKLDTYKAQLAKKAAEKAAKAAKKAAAEKAAAAKAAAEAAKKEKAKKEGKEEEKKEEEKTDEPEKKAEEVEEEEEETEQVDFAELDIFGVEEVEDIGGGMPLFKDFGHEDWALMSLGFELHLMASAFKKDCNDEERLGINLEHLPFYYNKYYGKPLVNKSFGVDETSDLLKLAKEFIFMNKSQVLESLLDEEWEYPQVFVKITEELRRHRALLVAMGDDSAKLKIANAGGYGNQAAKTGGGGGWKHNAGKGKWGAW